MTEEKASHPREYRATRLWEKTADTACSPGIQRASRPSRSKESTTAPAESFPCPHRATPRAAAQQRSPSESRTCKSTETRGHSEATCWAMLQESNLQPAGLW